MHVVLALISVHVLICGASFLSASSSIGFVFGCIYECVFGYILHVLYENVYLVRYLHVLDEFICRICVFDECTGQLYKLFECTMIFILILIIY